MAPTNLAELSKRERTKVLFSVTFEALMSTAVVLGLYFVLPLDHFASDWFWLSIVVALGALAAMTAFQVTRVIKSPRPATRAVKALATTIPLFLVVFAVAYYILERSNSATFNVDSLTRVDCLYFAMTVLSTVGFGDIAPVTQIARGLVTVQMALDIIVIGLVFRVFTSAVQESWRRKAGDGTTASLEDVSPAPAVPDTTDTGAAG